MSEILVSERQPDDPLISVVVISYNFERYLAECLDSVLRQTLRPFEIIVFDDCSTDRSWDVISAYAARYPELFVTYRQPINVGHIANGTAARNNVRGELLSAIDGDDYWRADKLEQEWRVLREEPAARTAYSNVFAIDADGVQTGVWHAESTPPPPSGDAFTATMSRQFFTAMQSCHRNELHYTDAVRSIGGLASGESLHPDWDLKIRMAARFPVVYSGAMSVAYRSHGSNINATTSHEERLESMRRVVASNRDLLHARSAQERAYIEEHLAFLR